MSVEVRGGPQPLQITCLRIFSLLCLLFCVLCHFGRILSIKLQFIMVFFIKIGVFTRPWGSVGVRGGPWGSAAPANHVSANIFTFVSLILCFVSF